MSLPPGSGLIYRHFGAPERAALAMRLADACRRRRLAFLIGADPALAHACGANGVHWPARLAEKAAGLKVRCPHWMVTASAHSRADLARAGGADAVFISPVRVTRSAAARPVLGLARAGQLARTSPVQAIALGGVDPTDAALLARLGFAGLAGIDWALQQPGLRRERPCP